VHHFANGMQYKGEYDQGRMHGKGTEHHTDGTLYEVSYERGNLTKKLKIT